MLTTVIETDVPEKEWDDIDFTNADVLAGKSLMDLIKINGVANLDYHHFENEKDAQDMVGNP